MRTTISGDIEIQEPTPEIIAWIEANLTFNNPVYKNLERRGRMDVIVRKHVPKKIKAFTSKHGGYVVPFGCLYALWGWISKGEYELDFAPRHEAKFASAPCAVDLFDYQKWAVDEMVKAKGGVLKSACGSGKTYMGIEILRRLGLRFLWLCGKKDLLNQTYNDMVKLYPNIDVGKITNGEVAFGKDGSIATVQTLISVDRRLYEDEWDVVIVDECQHCCSDPQTVQLYSKVLGRCKARYKYGLTATPSRSDGLANTIYANLGLSPKGTFSPTCTIKDSMTQSLVAQYQAFPLETPDSFDYLSFDGSADYIKLIDYLANDDKRTESIVSKVASLVKNEGRKVALLSLRVSHVERMNEALQSRGIRSVSITGKSADKHRKEVLGKTDAWDVVVSTVSLFKEGLDIKALDTVAMAMPIKDKVGIIQSCGRAERPLEGKKQPIFLFFLDENIAYCATAERKIRQIINRRR